MSDPKEDPIRYLGDMQRLQVQPGDVYVLTLANPTHMLARKQIKDYWDFKMPGIKLIILEEGMKLGVIGVKSPGELELSASVPAEQGFTDDYDYEGRH